MFFVILDLLVMGSVMCLVLGCLPDVSERLMSARVSAELGEDPETVAAARFGRLLNVLDPINRSPKLELLRRWLGTNLASGHIALSSVQFLALKELMAGACAAGYVTLVGLSKVEPLWLVLSLVLGFFLPDLWLAQRIKRRKAAIARDLPEVVDLLNLCVQAGSDFNSGIHRVMREYRRCPLIEELAQVQHEIKVGKRRRDALKAMAHRVNMPEMASFVRTLVQADRMGTGLSDALRIQSEETRLRRYHQGERLAAQAPMKMLIPLILFIMPAVLIIVGGPIILQFMAGDFFGKTTF
ncbi:MAG: type II secretion system F family protein [Candidatus Omnitrophica bacterium]|nr:type II secretion system F family protein [Candidatus Omnitrophota bacterium]